jgi:ABC-2 type transport system permease protein/sodium transport system permease protein
MGAVIALTILWIALSPARSGVDLDSYPTTAFRVSVFVMGAIVSGVVEEIAFRGYMQSQLERIGPTFAIMLTSIVFVLSHINHGVAALLVIAPGYFLASVIYGELAIRSGSILPGMMLHVLGDAAHTFVVVLGGDATRLLAQ